MGGGRGEVESWVDSHEKPLKKGAYEEEGVE